MKLYSSITSRALLICGCLLGIGFSAAAFVPGTAPSRLYRDGTQSSWPSKNVFLLAQEGISEEESQQKEGGKTSINPTAPQKRRTWEESYALLLKFKEDHGHANVPNQYKEDPKLGSWLKDQKRKRFRFSPDKIEKLNALNITWNGADKEKYDQRWEDMFQCLEEFKEKAGHCCVPTRYEPNQKLANWVRRQRSMKTVGKQTPYRITKLESIGFVWRLREFMNKSSAKWEEKWERKFEELLEYHKENGHCQVPRDYMKNPKLAFWVVTQRKLHADGELREDRHERLNVIGFTWNFEEIFDEAWLSSYHQLIETKEELQGVDGGIRNIGERKTWARREQPLYSWEEHQQNLYKRGTLEPKRERMLTEIGYWDSLGLKEEPIQHADDWMA